MTDQIFAHFRAAIAVAAAKSKVVDGGEVQIEFTHDSMMPLEIRRRVCEFNADRMWIFNKE